MDPDKELTSEQEACIDSFLEFVNDNYSRILCDNPTHIGVPTFIMSMVRTSIVYTMRAMRDGYIDNETMLKHSDMIPIGNRESIGKFVEAVLAKDCLTIIK